MAVVPKREDVRAGFRPWLVDVRKPCEGMYMSRTEEGIAVVRLHYSADDTLTDEKLAAIAKKILTQEDWNQEMEGDADAMSGALVYPEFDAKKHVIPHEYVVYADPEKKVKRKGCLYMSIDPHPRTPHAALWAMVDRWGDWWIYRELWATEVRGTDAKLTDFIDEERHTVLEYADMIARLEGNSLNVINRGRDEMEYAAYTPNVGGERIVERFMDWAAKGFAASGEDRGYKESISERFQRYDICCLKPNKQHKAGEDAIRDLLRDRDDSRVGNNPRIHISSRCRELIWELKNYRYQQTQPHLLDRKELKQVGVESRCHMLDNLRYLATGDCGYQKTMESEIYA